MSTARPVLVALVVAASVVSVGVLAGLFAPIEGPLTDPVLGFGTTTTAGAACAGGFRVGASAVDVTPGVKRPDGSYDLWMEPFTDLNGNGVYDAPEPTETPYTPSDPTSASQRQRALDDAQRPDRRPDPFEDLNGNGKWDGPFMAGYGRKKAGNAYYVASAVHDPVWARAVAFTCGDLTVGAVSVDTVGLFRGFVLDVRKIAANLAPLDEYDHVAVASTHTHDSVDTMGLWGPSTLIDGKDPRTMAHYRDGILEALKDALADRRVVGSVKLGMNETRHLIPVAGTIQTDLRDPFVIDDRILAAQFLDGSGATIATVVNWSPHPETLAGTKSEISSDYADKLRRALETEGATVGGATKGPLGGTAVFFSGAVGGMMTTLGAKPKDEAGNVLPDSTYAKSDRIGEVAAWAAMHALGSAPTQSVDALRLGVREVNAPADNALLLALNTLGIFDHEVALGPALVPALGEPGIVAPIPFFRVEVNALTLGSGGSDLLQILTVPGELLPEVALGNPLGHGANPTLDACYDYLPAKKLFNGAREGKINVTNPASTDRAGWARVLAARPAYPKEPAILSYATAPNVMLLGLANDELGYIVPANDYEPFTLFPEVYGHGRDRCGDDDHYEETVSASSLLAPVVANALVSLLDPTFVPAVLPASFAGTLSEDGSPEPVPGWETRGVWMDTSRSAGYDAREDLRVVVSLPAGLPGTWGFLDGHNEDMGMVPGEEMRGLWIDMDGDGEPSPGDAALFFDAFAFSEGQPHWRP